MSIDTVSIDTVSIDLNSDVGESFGNWAFGDDRAIFASVTSANVACGFHAGDPRGIRETVCAARCHGVRVGAHPGYRDLQGFGRRYIDVEPGELTADVLYQIGALDVLARAEGTRVEYVKPHGALYNRIARDERHALAVIEAVLTAQEALADREGPRELPLLVLPGTVIDRLAREHGLRTIGEAFADRRYRADGTLVPRSETGAVLADVDAVLEQARYLARGYVLAADGEERRIDVQSICVHSDTPGALEMARRIREMLESEGIPVRSFLSQDASS